VGEPGPYDRLAPLQLEGLALVQEEIADGRSEAAAERIDALLRAAPQNLWLAALRQDLELEALQLGGSIPELDADLRAAGRSLAGGPRDRLRRWYAVRAESLGTAFDLVLAARIEDDELAALRLLDEAVSVDPACVWAHYGRAHALLRLKRVEEASAALDRALDLDASHPRARRLETALLALGKDREPAIAALRTWLRETEGDPRVGPFDQQAAVLDLVELELGAERYAQAYGRLAAMEGMTPQLEVRRLLYLVVAADGVGAFDEALAAARRAGELQPENFRAHVHEALLLEARFGDRTGARDAWALAAETAAAASSAGLDGDAALQLLAARVELARLDRSLGKSQASSAP
jgi:tetratricopeptide (TPR) repeat protein